MGFSHLFAGIGPQPLMSALGQKRTLHRSNGMSALPPKADIRSGTLAMAAEAQEQRSALGVLSVSP
jgi:hypothetical protein